MISKKKSEASFTLIETVMALGLMVGMILEVASVQGNAIHFTLWSRKATQATWLASALMAEIEYKSKFYPIKELKTDLSLKDRNFSESLCPKTQSSECSDMTYTVTIEEFKLPILDLMLGGGYGGEGSSEASGGGDALGGFGSLVKDQIKNILGDEIMKIAQVEVFWPEGATQDSVSLSYLILNQQSLDTYIETMEPYTKGKQGNKTSKNGNIPAPANPNPEGGSETSGDSSKETSKEGGDQ